MQKVWDELQQSVLLILGFLILGFSILLRVYQ
jgi:hypothetical protein